MNKNRKMNELETESKRDQDAMKKNFEDKVTISLREKYIKTIFQETQLLKQLKALEDDLKELRAKNKVEESNLRDKKGRDEGFLKELIEQYDEMMENKETEINDLEVKSNEKVRFN